LFDKELVHGDGFIVLADLLVRASAVNRGLRGLVTRGGLLQGYLIKRRRLTPGLGTLGAVGHLLGLLVGLRRVHVIAARDRGPRDVTLGDLLLLAHGAAVGERRLREGAALLDVVLEVRHRGEALPGFVAVLG